VTGSIRQQVAQNLVDTCVFGGLNEVYGCNLRKNTDQHQTFWESTFCKARNLDGSIRVYSPTFIMIKWVTRYSELPHKGKEIFHSEEAAKTFLIKNFVRS
jgi:hypothetical protein